MNSFKLKASKLVFKERYNRIIEKLVKLTYPFFFYFIVMSVYLIISGDSLPKYNIVVVITYVVVSLSVVFVMLVSLSYIKWRNLHLSTIEYRNNNLRITIFKKMNKKHNEYYVYNIKGVDNIRQGKTYWVLEGIFKCTKVTDYNNEVFDVVKEIKVPNIFERIHKLDSFRRRR